MFTLKIKRDPESPDDPGSELWIANVMLVSNLGRRPRREVIGGCWSGYDMRDYGQSLYTPVMRPARELHVNDCVWLGDGMTQADGRPVPSGIWNISRVTSVTMVVPASSITVDTKPVVELRLDHVDSEVGITVSLDPDLLVSTSPLVPNPDLLMTLLYVEQAGGVAPWWCIVQTAWLLGPDGQTIERVAP